MLKYIIPCIVLLSLLPLIRTTAEAPVQEVPYQQTEWTVDDVKALVDTYADKYSVSRQLMHKVVSCESGYKYNAVGDGGKSFGLSQIHSPSHPSVTYKQATNADFALEFMASNIAKGKGKMWTCYRMVNV